LLSAGAREIEAAAAAPRPARRSWRRRLAPPTLVLAYHRVTPLAGRDRNQLCVSPVRFAAQLRWLRANCRVLSETEFLAQLDWTLPGAALLDGGRPRVLITFDDGYADNVHHALPALVAQNASATLFVTSGLVGGAAPFWWDALEQAVFDGAAPAAGWSPWPGETIPAADAAEQTYTHLHRLLLPLASGERDAALARLAAQAGVRPTCDEDSRPVTRAELGRWSAAGGAIGAHTRTHVQLAAQRDDVVVAEIAGARRELQDLTGQAIATLAYPFGTGGDFDGRAEAAARAAGYRCAFANRVGNVRWARNRFALPRCLVRDWPADEFAARFRAWCPG
jgi:peptidoglycan/xylan/chitin deacetylase (PgdA/CDA1 family)